MILRNDADERKEHIVIVLLEGADFAGKSTVAEALVAEFGGEVVGNGQPPDKVALVEHYLAQVIKAAGMSELTVFDRLHVGELIYGPLFRSRCQLTDAEVLSIEEELDKARAIKIHVDAADDTLLERLRGPRGDDLVSKERDLLDIAAEYRRLLRDNASGLFSRWTSLESSDAVALAKQRLLGT